MSRMNDAGRRHKAKVAKHEVVEKPEFTISKEDEERLIALFERMPCDLSEPEMTPEQQAAYDKEVAWEEAFRKEVEAKFGKSPFAKEPRPPA